MQNRNTTAALRFHEATKYLPVMDESGANLIDVAMGPPPDRGQAMGEQDPALTPHPYKVYETLEPIPLPTNFPPTTMQALDAIASTGEVAVAEALPDLAAIARLCLLDRLALAHRADLRAIGDVEVSLTMHDCSERSHPFPPSWLTEAQAIAALP